jgi:hypothetical protein
MEKRNGPAAPQPEEFFYGRAVPPERRVGCGDLGEDCRETIEPKRLGGHFSRKTDL